METTTTTLRDQALDAMLEQVAERAAREHQRNYHKLHIRRDGTVSWHEAIDQHSDIIDGGAKGFAAVPSVCRVGTGSCECNCPWCEDAGYESTEDAIADAVAESDLDQVRDEMIQSFDEIPVGYFYDEEEPEKD